jgi:4-amino-4-deoxy-L-arabinose transferase-like glycosyltransferase
MKFIYRYSTTLILILAASVFLRIAASFYLGNQVVEMPAVADQLSYHNLALRLLHGYGFSFESPWWPATRAGAPTAHWSYLYTAYLAAVYFIFGPNPLAARLIQAVLVGLLQPLLVFLIVRRIFTPTAGLAAAGLTAFYTYFIYFSAALMTEPFFITAILASLYLAVSLVDRLRQDSEYKDGKFTQKSNRGSIGSVGLAVGLGLCLSAAVLMRQVYLLFIPLLFFWIWWSSGRRKVHLLVIPGVILIASILPFTYYNQSRFDHFVLLNTNAGFAFFWANHSVYAGQFEPILESSQYLSLIPVEFHHMNEAQLDSALLREGFRFVLGDPINYIRLSLSRFPVFFMFWPTSESGFISSFLRASSFGILWPFMLYGLLVSFIHWKKHEGINKKPIILLISFILFYTILHLLTWALIRYRMPVDSILLMFAGFALADLAERISQKIYVSRSAKI